MDVQRYRYGASRNAARLEIGHVDDGGRFRLELRQLRQRFAQSDSGFRALIGRRNDLIAECVQDRLSATRIAAALGVPTWVVRTAAGDSGELPPSGISRQNRLEQLREMAAELVVAEAERTTLENERRSLVVAAHRHSELDVFELASLTGLTPEYVRRMTRGVRKAS